MAYGSSQARGRIRATGASLRHSHGNAGSELRLQPTPQLTEMPDPSHICNQHHSSRQCRILNPLSEARDRTRNLMVPSQIRFCCATTGTPLSDSLMLFYPE